MLISLYYENIMTSGEQAMLREGNTMLYLIHKEWYDVSMVNIILVKSTL